MDRPFLSDQVIQFIQYQALDIKSYTFLNVTKTMLQPVLDKVANHVDIKLYACWTFEAEEDVSESTELHLKRFTSGRVC